METKLIAKISGVCLLFVSIPSFQAMAQTTRHKAITPIPETIEHNAQRALLGKQLFNDPILSKNNKLACVSCHVLSKGGADNQPHSIGVDGRMTETNTPTVFNSIYNFRFGWDGRSKSYEDLLTYMITHPTMLSSNWKSVIDKLSSNTNYSSQFKNLYTDGITQKNIVNAFHEYQKTLITPNSRFDQYLMGNENALTDNEKEGYRLFKSTGCISCHQGINVGGNLYEKLGIYKDYFADKANITTADYGKYNVTGDEEDKYVFKVPGLRNVALTAPYFHDGSQATLEDAIQTMAIYQNGKEIHQTYVNQISAFLKTLTGEPLSDKP